jgi:DNA/RNA endonuclease YhcR with UshA esterase domain
MKARIFVVALAFTATSALAQQVQVIAPNQAAANVGRRVTVEGAVSAVHHSASGKVTFIDIGGRYPDSAFTAVIFADDDAKFPNVDALEGKTIDVTGTVKLYQGRPEIVLNDAAQVKAK